MRDLAVVFAVSSVALCTWTLGAGTGCSSTPSAPADAGGNGDVATNDAPTDGTADSGGGPYCPAGTTLTPFKSATRIATFSKADMVLDGTKDYFAVIEADVGRIVLDLYEKDTPITVNSFVFLALNHFYDGVAFHRVIDGFMAQGGDPNTVDKPNNTWGTGDPGYTFGLG